MRVRLLCESVEITPKSWWFYSLSTPGYILGLFPELLTQDS